MKRRNLLKKIGVSAAVGTVGLSNLASANVETVDAQTMRQHLADNEDLLRELADDGVLDHPGLGQFELDEHAHPGASEEGVARTVATNFAGDRTTPVYTLNHETDDGFITIRIRPEIDLVTASIQTADGEKTIYGGQDSDEVSAQCHGGCDDRCLYEVCDNCPGNDCDECCWCEPTCTTNCLC